MNYLEPYLTCDIPKNKVDALLVHFLFRRLLKEYTSEIVRLLFGAANCAFKIVRYFTDKIPFSKSAQVPLCKATANYQHEYFIKACNINICPRLEVKTQFLAKSAANLLFVRSCRNEPFFNCY